MSKLLFSLCFTAALFGALDPDLPSPAPSVRGAFPPGAQRGTTVEVELSGQNLQDARSVEFAGRGVRAKVVAAFGSKVKMEVSVAADAEVGRRDYRLTTSRGVYVGIFDIGGLPEIVEKENNDDWRKPQAIAHPVLVNGNIGSEDWDHFRFHANAGEQLIFDVSATRYGSRLDADVAILDERGNELAWVDDTTIFGDPHLEFRFEKAGDYVVRVGSLNGGGNYRLAVGALPYAHRTLPAGLQAGKATVLTFTGALLDRVDEIWIGDRVAKGQIVSKSAGLVRARFLVPAKTAPGPASVHLAAKGMEVALPTEIRISALTEVTVERPALDWKTAVAVTPSLVLNGVIEQTKSSHFFRFDANAGDTFLFRAESMKLGYHLDPTITVLDSEGKKVAFADDPGVDDRSDEYQLDTDLSLRCEKTGPYYVAVRDGMYRGGDQLLYRLTVLKQAPDFLIEVRDSLKSFYAGQQDTLQVRVRRRSGWDAPVEIWAEGLPAGVAAERQTAAPKDSIVKDTCGVERVVDGTIALVPVRVSSGANGIFDFKIKGRGVMNGRTVEHEATVRYNHASVGYLYGPMQVERAQIAVSTPPQVMVGGPDSLALGDKPAVVKLNVRRFGDAKQRALLIRAKAVPDGLRVTTVPVPLSAREASVSVDGTAAAGSRLTFEVVSEQDGSVVAESAPILIEAKK